MSLSFLSISKTDLLVKEDSSTREDYSSQSGDSRIWIPLLKTANTLYVSMNIFDMF